MLAQKFVFVSRPQLAIVRQVIEGFAMPFYAVRTGRNPGIYKDWYINLLLCCCRNGLFFWQPFWKQVVSAKEPVRPWTFWQCNKRFRPYSTFFTFRHISFQKKILLFTHGLLFLFTFCNFKNAFEENMTDTMNI